MGVPMITSEGYTDLTYKVPIPGITLSNREKSIANGCTYDHK